MTTFEIVDREHTSGSQGGTDYGSKALTVLARSPKAVLLWMPGHSYFGGIGMRNYASAYMLLVKERRLGGWKTGDKEDFRHNQDAPATRLSPALVMERAERINQFFEADVATQIAQAVKTRQTLLIDGGGEALRKDYNTERKKAQAHVQKIAAQASVARSIEPEGVACCRQCGVKLTPSRHKHWVEDGDVQPTSLEDLQRRFNDLRVLAVGPHNTVDKAHLIGTYTTWDGVSYDNGPYFCTEGCAENYAVRAVEAYAPLPIIPQPTAEELAAQERAKRDAVWGL
ncbi:hypothetical protein HOU02_gp399 [Caulobacter phage CcrBL9]|uniref:Uncharacterized protein n=1 Tax=Caulobacter phage CcrBL9 TaxID=2283270 RepID=A0A385ECB9_9CAUD|nr:hypothetical protein HOU02_gp399 [Caulobacter phage CcrBL9]AXQ69326.1 hypothetical protein CcrBL9_gp302 [Caulobacter phage CcrBL9]